jgi:hypothetical protein
MVVMLEQWPMRSAWILQIIDSDHQTEQALGRDGRKNMALKEFYYKYVEARVFNIQLKNCPAELRKSYQKIFELDADPELYDSLLCNDSVCGLLVKDIGDLTTRKSDALFSYTINLNPALRSVLAAVSGHREDVEEMRAVFQKPFFFRGIENIERDGNTPSEQFTTPLVCKWLDGHFKDGASAKRSGAACPHERAGKAAKHRW